MKNKKEIAELLPNKEDYSLNNAGAASIWIKDFNKGNISKKQIILIKKQIAGVQQNSNSNH